MKKWSIIILILMGVMMVSLAIAGTFYNRSLNDFVAGTFYNTTYNASDSSIHLGQRKIGVQYNNTFDWNDSLVALYHFDNNTLDYSGNGYDATQIGTNCSINTKGKINTSCDFETTQDDYIDAGITAGFVSNLTVCAWVNLESKTNSHGIISKRIQGSDDSFQLAYSQTTDSFQALSWSGDAFKASAGTSQPSVGVWIHACLTHNGSRTFLYVNGTLENYTDPGAIDVTGDAIHIGKTFNSNFDMDGLIDEVAIWNRTLTPAEIKIIYEQQKGDYTKGNYTSKVFDAGAQFSWNMTWNYTGNKINLSVRNCSANPCTTEWTYINSTPPQLSLNNYNFSRYFQYKFTFDNANQKLFNVTLWNYTIAPPPVDTSAPTWNEYPNNITEYQGSSVYTDFNATDDTAISMYFLNDTSRFNITSGGGELRNKSYTGIGTYYINVSVNDTSNNINSTIFLVTILTPPNLTLCSSSFINYSYSVYDDNTGIVTTHRLGYFMAIASAIGFAGMLISLKRNKGEDDY